MHQVPVDDDRSATKPPMTTAPSTRSQRRPLFAVLSGLLILLGAAGGALVFLNTGASVEVLAARVHVARGVVMTAEMFTTVTIAPNQQLTYLGAEELSSLLGKRAAHDVAAGALVGPGAGVEAMIPATGRSVVGLSLPPGAEPAIPLLVGDQVRVILTEPAYACAAGETGIADAGTGCSVDVVIPGLVVATARDAASGQVTVSVDVAAADAPRTAAAAALGRAAVVLDSRDN